MSGRDDRIRELYEAALERPIGERAAFVGTHSQGDEDLKLRVNALLTGQQDTELPGYEQGDGASLLSAGTAIGQYRIDGPLGAGGMGVVYRATDLKLNRPAAIKVLPENLADPEARRRFQREAQTASSLNHPHIVTVYDAGEYQGRQYLITEYVDGGTLRQWAARPRGWRSIVELLVGVADAVAVAHEAGILHRDIKPENILLAKNGYAKLADFGLAKLLEADPLADDAFAGVRPDAHSSLVGTAAYMSPEQAQGLPLDGRSDVYSFGLVLHELLSGQRPDAARALDQRHGGAPAALAPLGGGVPAELRTLVAKALEHDPADRYQTMRDLVVDLRRVVRRSGIDDGASVAPRDGNDGLTASPGARKRRHRLAMTLAIAAAALSIGALAALFALRAPPVSAVAVLPFANETGSPDDSHINEGLGTELRRRLMEVPTLRVQARASSVSAAGLNLEPRTIAERLNVAVLVNGSLQRRGDRLRVLVEVLNADGELLATWNHERSDRELLALESDIAADVMGFFAPNAVAATAQIAPTRERESAHELVLRGTEYERPVRDNLTVDEAKLRLAIDFYRRAAEADPNSIEAHSRLAGALVYLGDIDAARVSLERAHDLAESDVVTTQAELSDLYYTTALYLLQSQSPGIEQAYRTAIQLNPSNADAVGAFAQWLMTHDQARAADPYFAAALDLDRERLSRYVDYAEYLAILEDMDRVRALGAEIRARFPDARGDRALARLYETTGELDVAIAHALAAYRAEPLDPETAAQVAELYARIGLFDKADEFEPEPGLNQLYFRRQHARLVEDASELMFEYPEDIKIRYMLAFAMNATDDSRNALRILEGAGMPIEPDAEFMSGAADEALTTFIDALQVLGEREELARNLAERKAATFDRSLDRSWWVLSYQACTQAQLGRLDDALILLEGIKLSQGLALSPFLEDAQCFRRVAGNPRYEGVLDHLEARQQALRARLPMTLQEHGVAAVLPRH